MNIETKQCRSCNDVNENKFSNKPPNALNSYSLHDALHTINSFGVGVGVDDSQGLITACFSNLATNTKT